MISAFEYVTVLISIVVGLGITEILTGIADLIKKNSKIRLYWPHLLWVLFVLLLLVQEWWVTYELKTFEPWRLPTFLFIMLYPTNLFVLARLLFPNILRRKKIDLKKFYYENYRKIFLLLVISAILSVTYNLLILDLRFVDQLLQILLIGVFVTTIIGKFSNEKLHKALPIVVLLIFCLSIIIEWNVWLIQ